MAAAAPSEADGGIVGINVTPFVDVALVLLIIFMITAKLVSAPRAIPLDLPRTTPSTAVPAVVSLRVDAAGAVSADARPITDDQIVAYMRERRRAAGDVRAVIAADPRVPHGRVVHVIDLVRRAGVERFAIQPQSEESP